MPASHLGKLLHQLQHWRPSPHGMLVYVDVRDIRTINRSGLPNADDHVIEEVLNCIKAWAGDGAIVGRLWSNELLACCTVDDVPLAIERVARLRRRLTDIRYPSALGENRVAASIGIHLVQGEVSDWPREIAEAGLACEGAKKRGLNQILERHRLGGTSSIATIDTTQVLSFRQLRQENRLTLFGQPIMDITGVRPRLAKVEFLIRAEQDGRYLPLPMDMIQVLESLELSDELDTFSAECALTWLRQNPVVVEQLDSCTLNLSARSIANGGFMERLYDIVRAQPLPPGKLGFEITETAAIDHLEVAAEWIARFDRLGCFFSLDDFGSGLCSFGYLQSLPVQEVKIDGRFVREIARNPVSREIVRAIHQVASAAGKRTVAEFVDESRKLAVLRELGIHYAQGWLFHTAMPLHQLLERIERGEARR